MDKKLMQYQKKTVANIHKQFVGLSGFVGKTQVINGTCYFFTEEEGARALSQSYPNPKNYRTEVAYSESRKSWFYSISTPAFALNGKAC